MNNLIRLHGEPCITGCMWIFMNFFSGTTPSQKQQVLPPRINVFFTGGSIAGDKNKRSRQLYSVRRYSFGPSSRGGYQACHRQYGGIYPGHLFTGCLRFRVNTFSFVGGRRTVLSRETACWFRQQRQGNSLRSADRTCFSTLGRYLSAVQ